MTPRFVIAGTGRHGSHYVAQVLTAVGIRTGHEQWWNSAGAAHDGLVGDSSWLAAPHLAEFDGTVFHQVRDPLRVVNSLVCFPEPKREDEVRRRAVTLRGSAVEQAVQMVLHWRRMCDAACVARWRLEDFSGATVMMIAARIGVHLDADAVIEALEATPPSNHHAKAMTIGWDDLPPSLDTLSLRRAAERDGYA